MTNTPEQTLSDLLALVDAVRMATGALREDKRFYQAKTLEDAPKNVLPAIRSTLGRRTMTPDADLHADLIHDGLLWHTLYERDGRWWNGYVVARSEQEARDNLNPDEELDGQIIAEMPDDGAADHAIAARTKVLNYLHESPVCPYCRRPIND